MPISKLVPGHWETSGATSFIIPSVARFETLNRMTKRRLDGSTGGFNCPQSDDQPRYTTSDHFPGMPGGRLTRLGADLEYVLMITPLVGDMRVRYWI